MLKVAAVLCIGISLSQSVLAQAPARDTNLVTIVNPVWMPDGKSIIISAILFDRTRKNLPKFGVFELNLLSKELKLLIPNASDAVPSPDQKTIAFARPTGARMFDNDLYLFDIKSGKETPLIVDTVAQFAPGWSPDGKKLVYNNRAKQELGPSLAEINIMVIDLSTRQSHEVISGNHKNYNPVWAPSGDKIVYYHEKGDNRDQIYLTDAKGSFHKNLTADTSTHNYYPSWLKDKIIYTTSGGQTGSGSQLAMVDQDGSNKQIFLAQRISRAFYNAKANQLVYVISSRGRNPTINIYDLKTKKEAVIFTNDQVEALFDIKTGPGN